jgi:serine phosphatase RsbU (regulator of sigma subunit)
MDGTRLEGMLIIEGDPDQCELSLPDLHALSAIATQVSLIIQTFRAAAHRSQRERLERDLQLAREIQLRFLPRLSNRLCGVGVAVEYRPAYNVGGDFYDLVETGGGEILAVVGDVAGKGVPAALLMSRISSEFRRLARVSASPEVVLSQLNQSMVGQAPEDSFATAVCLRLDVRRLRVTVANAGHIAPLVRRASGGVVRLGEPSGLPIGMMPGQAYENETFALDPGDLMLLMTDGVVEPLDGEGDRLGSERMKRLISSAPADALEIHRRILAEVDRKLTGGRADDVTLLSLSLPYPAGNAAA